MLSVTIWGQISQTIEIFVSLWLHRGEVLLHWELAGPVQFLMLRVGSIDHCLMTHYPTLLHWPTKNTKLRSFIFFYGALVMIFFLVLMYITLKSDKTGLGHSDNGSHDANHFISFDIALHIFLNRVNIKVDLQVIMQWAFITCIFCIDKPECSWHIFCPTFSLSLKVQFSIHFLVQRQKKMLSLIHYMLGNLWSFNF